MESFIIPNKNKNPNPTTQEQMTVNPSQPLLSVLTKNSWLWDSRATRNRVFTIIS